jgi:hypothetical protein
MSCALDEFISIRCLDETDAAMNALFQRKFRADSPEFPLHIVAYVRDAEGLQTLCFYSHITDCGDLALGGGVCSDERVLRRLTSPQRDALREAGGIYRHTIDWFVTQFCDRFPALFVYVGDRLSERVLRSAGFESTSVDRLLVRWLQDPSDRRRQQLVAKAKSFIPF